MFGLDISDPPECIRSAVMPRKWRRLNNIPIVEFPLPVQYKSGTHSIYRNVCGSNGHTGDSKAFSAAWPKSGRHV